MFRPISYKMITSARQAVYRKRRLGIVIVCTRNGVDGALIDFICALRIKTVTNSISFLPHNTCSWHVHSLISSWVVCLLGPTSGLSLSPSLGHEDSEIITFVWLILRLSGCVFQCVTLLLFVSLSQLSIALTPSSPEINVCGKLGI